MVSDLDLVNLCAAAYSGDRTAFDHTIEINQIYAGVLDKPDGFIIAFRGSLVLVDWLRDIEAVRLQDVISVGPVAEGFYTGLSGVLDAIDAASIGKSIYITGHSLGAAHAAILGGLLVSLGIKPAKIVLFGCPRPGGEKLKYLLSGVAISSYKNRYDPVTDVPIPFPLSFTHVRGMIGLNIDPGTGLILDDHHIANYQKGLQNGKSPS